MIQTFWVGGLWLVHFVIFPVLGKTGLAQLLVEDFRAEISPLMVAFAGLGVVVQAILLRLSGSRDWRGDARWHLLMAVLVLCLVYAAVSRFVPEAGWWRLFLYLLLSFVGALLVIQPAPYKVAVDNAQA
ncbi:DUF4149 domain-containing protein [Pseudomonas sp. LRF_L74]|uniref:DUF4149 domain-containing protein n=1 Tax=Pseudomonas sp. LRF_L74 TaxID=3369422 RepID=UPI003F60DFA6